MNDVIISVKNVALLYRKRKSFFRHSYYEALTDVSFEINHGETVGIVGKNGAGKSTLLKLLAGIYKPDRGEILNLSKKTSLLTLQAGFDENLGGAENVVLSGMLLGYTKSVIKDKLDDIKEYSELGNFFYEPIKTYSTGMRARLGFATNAFLLPEVLLLDEVLGVGDSKFRLKSAKTMEEMIKSDRTVILVSHSSATMLELCNKVIWIENGVVKAQGEPLAILEEYEMQN